MSGLAYFFKPKINPTESTSSATTAEKRSGRRSKSSKSAEIVEKPPTPVEAVEASPEVKPMAEEQVENPPSATPKIKLKFNLRSQSVQDTSDDRFLSTVNVKHQTTCNPSNALSLSPLFFLERTAQPLI